MRTLSNWFIRVLGTGDNGQGAVQGGAAYSPSLDFSDSRNSQYSFFW